MRMTWQFNDLMVSFNLNYNTLKKTICEYGLTEIFTLYRQSYDNTKFPKYNLLQMSPMAAGDFIFGGGAVGRRG